VYLHSETPPRAPYGCDPGTTPDIHPLAAVPCRDDRSYRRGHQSLEHMERLLEDRDGATAQGSARRDLEAKESTSDDHSCHSRLQLVPQSEYVLPGAKSKRMFAAGDGEGRGSRAGCNQQAVVRHLSTPFEENTAGPTVDRLDAAVDELDARRAQRPEDAAAGRPGRGIPKGRL
jgi:hypothetical protein